MASKAMNAASAAMPTAKRRQSPRTVEMSRESAPNARRMWAYMLVLTALEAADECASQDFRRAHVSNLERREGGLVLAVSSECHDMLD